MFENFDDILNVDDVAKALKIGTSQEIGRAHV